MSQSNFSLVPISMLSYYICIFSSIQNDSCLNDIGCQCCCKPRSRNCVLSHSLVRHNEFNKLCFASKDMNRKNSSIEKLRFGLLENDQIGNDFDAKLS